MVARGQGIGVGEMCFLKKHLFIAPVTVCCGSFRDLDELSRSFTIRGPRASHYHHYPLIQTQQKGERKKHIAMWIFLWTRPGSSTSSLIPWARMKDVRKEGSGFRGALPGPCLIPLFWSSRLHS